MAKRTCGCVYADAWNTPSVKSGHETGGYLKTACENHRRIESAIAPAAINPQGVEGEWEELSTSVLQCIIDGRISGRISEWPQIKPAIATALETNATLARQLSSTQDELDDYKNAALHSADDLRAKDEAIASLARQLAEAKADNARLDTECKDRIRQALENGQAFHAAEAQLAEANRRLAAVEGALDHIARVGMGSRKQTKRTQWIVVRAVSALNGDENWRGQETPRGYHDALDAALQPKELEHECV